MRIIYPAFAAGIVALSACGSSGGSSSGGAGSNSGKQTIAGVPANGKGTKDVTGMPGVQIEADNFYFEPSIVKGSPGQRLTVTVKNVSSTEHTFTVTSPNVNKELGAGKSATVSLTLPASGTISFFCEYHKALGMAGGLQAG